MKQPLSSSASKLRSKPFCLEGGEIKLNVSERESCQASSKSRRGNNHKRSQEITARTVSCSPIQADIGCVVSTPDRPKDVVLCTLWQNLCH